MTHGYKGTFTVIDGLDGIGKGVVLDSIVSHLKDKGLRIFDLHDFWKEHHVHPDFENPPEPGNYHYPLDSFDVLVSSEPTYAGIGLAIREEITAKNGRRYSARFTADSYSMDRFILYKRVLLPALKAGKKIIQSRSVSTSIIYQSLQSTLQDEKPLTVDDITALEGNSFALNNAPDLLIVPTIEDVSAVIDRLKGREKDDNCEFENIDFQLKLKPFYESSQLRKIFESKGTVVKYLDAGKSLEDTKKQAIEIYSSLF